MIDYKIGDIVHRKIHTPRKYIFLGNIDIIGDMILEKDVREISKDKGKLGMYTYFPPNIDINDKTNDYTTSIIFADMEKFEISKEEHWWDIYNEEKTN